MSGAAPEVVTFGIADLFFLFAFVVLLGLKLGWGLTVGAVLKHVADLIDFRLPRINIPWTKTGVGGGRPFGVLADALRGVDNFAQRTIANGIEGLQPYWHRWLLWQAYILTRTGDEIAALSHDLLHYAKRHALQLAPAAILGPLWFLIEPRVAKLIRGVLPHASATKIVTEAAPALRAEVGRLEKDVARVEHAVATLPKTVTRVVYHEAAPAVARAVAVPVPHLGGLEADLGRLERLAKRVGWIGAFAGVAALGGAILARLHLGWLKCSNVGKAGRNVCGMNPDLLESLLADTLLIVGTVSLVEFAKGMQGVVRDVEGPIRKFWRVA